MEYCNNGVMELWATRTKRRFLENFPWLEPSFQYSIISVSQNFHFTHPSIIPVGLSFVLQIGVGRRKMENHGADHSHWRWIGRV